MTSSILDAIKFNRDFYNPDNSHMPFINSTAKQYFILWYLIKLDFLNKNIAKKDFVRAQKHDRGELKILIPYLRFGHYWGILRLIGKNYAYLTFDILKYYKLRRTLDMQMVSPPWHNYRYHQNRPPSQENPKFNFCKVVCLHPPICWVCILDPGKGGTLRVGKHHYSFKDPGTSDVG